MGWFGRRGHPGRGVVAGRSASLQRRCRSPRGEADTAAWYAEFVWGRERLEFGDGLTISSGLTRVRLVREERRGQVVEDAVAELPRSRFRQRQGRRQDSHCQLPSSPRFHPSPFSPWPRSFRMRDRSVPGGSKDDKCSFSVSFAHLSRWQTPNLPSRTEPASPRHRIEQEQPWRLPMESTAMTVGSHEEAGPSG